jgi:inhibitor of cysteine peptidase
MFANKRLLHIVVVLFLLVLADSPQPSCKTMFLDESDSNTRVVLYVGDTITVRLKSNITTGYSWSPAALPASLHQTDRKTEPGKSGRAGEPGFQSFTFTATAVGESTLHLNYARPFEKNSPPARTFTVTISIEPKPSPPST